MGKTGIDLFTSIVANMRAIVTAVANYTVLATDEYVKMNATATVTLPVLSTYQGTTKSRSFLVIENVSTAANNYITTVSAGTGNTIGGRASISLRVGEKVMIAADETQTDWEIMYPSPMAPGVRNNVVLIVGCAQTTAPQNLVDASGSPVAGIIVSALSMSGDTTASNVIIKNGNGTVCTIAKGTYVGYCISATSLNLPTVAVGDALTAEMSDATATARVEVILSTQTLTANG